MENQEKVKKESLETLKELCENAVKNVEKLENLDESSGIIISEKEKEILKTFKSLCRDVVAYIDINQKDCKKEMLIVSIEAQYDTIDFRFSEIYDELSIPRIKVIEDILSCSKNLMRIIREMD